MMDFSKKKIKRRKNRFHFNLKNDLHEIGYELEIEKIIKALGILYAFVIFAGYVYKLHIPLVVTLLIVATLGIPYHIYHTYNNIYDGFKWKTRFNYMEQMLSSFKRHPKILLALQDNLTIFAKQETEADKRMYKAIMKAVEVIQLGKEDGKRGIYKNAFLEIEKEFGCHRITVMHDYMEKVELNGGERYKEAADILLNEHRLWKTNIEKLKKEQKTKHTGIFIVTGVCICICALPSFLNSLMNGFSDSILYQICSTIFLIVAMIQLLIAENKLNSWWDFDSEVADEDKVMKKYATYQNFDMKKFRKNYMLISLLCLALGVTGIILHSYIVAIICIFYGLYMQRYPTSKYNGIKNSIKNTLEFQYPQWIMELSLLLQTESVQVSLYQGSLKAPLIIRNEVAKLLARLEKETNSVEPYNDFFNDLKIDTIATSMRNLYSVENLGSEKDSALLNLIEHNNVLLNKSEELKGQKKISIWAVYMYVPLLIGGMKIIMDTFLLCGMMIGNALQNI